jgi:hypothetical protein
MQKRYHVTLEGLNPLLMHRDNLAYSEKIGAWQKAPENKGASVAGDDRSPPWTWIGYLYHDGTHIGVDADNIMTMLREGGAKVVKKGRETYKKNTQSGILSEQSLWKIDVGNGEIPLQPFRELIGELDFAQHLLTAEKYGIELLIKRARIGQAKHIRVRPYFRGWSLSGSLTVLDEELSGITKKVLSTILKQAGALCGLCDWRPSSPKSPGTFGTFRPIIKAIRG